MRNLRYQISEYPKVGWNGIPSHQAILTFQPSKSIQVHSLTQRKLLYGIEEYLRRLAPPASLPHQLRQSSAWSLSSPHTATGYQTHTVKQLRMPLVATVVFGSSTLADSLLRLQERHRKFPPDDPCPSTPYSPKDVSAKRLAQQSRDT